MDFEWLSFYFKYHPCLKALLVTWIDTENMKQFRGQPLLNVRRDRYNSRLKWISKSACLERFWLVCGKDSDAVHQHHPGQAAEPLHRWPELHQSIQLQKRPQPDKRWQGVQHPGGPTANLWKSRLSRRRVWCHHASGCVWGKQQHYSISQNHP